jgi:hypothetical protein
MREREDYNIKNIRRKHISDNFTVLLVKIDPYQAKVIPVQNFQIILEILNLSWLFHSANEMHIKLERFNISQVILKFPGFNELFTSYFQDRKLITFFNIIRKIHVSYLLKLDYFIPSNLS